MLTWGEASDNSMLHTSYLFKVELKITICNNYNKWLKLCAHKELKLGTLHQPWLHKFVHQSWLSFAHHASTPMNLHQSLQKSKDYHL